MRICPHPDQIIMETNEKNYQVLLSVQRALLGEIYPAIRAITIKWNSSSELIMDFYFDHPITDDDKENVSALTTEIYADGYFEKVTENCTYSADAKIVYAPLDFVVYARKE